MQWIAGIFASIMAFFGSLFGMHPTPPAPVAFPVVEQQHGAVPTDVHTKPYTSFKAIATLPANSPAGAGDNMNVPLISWADTTALLKACKVVWLQYGTKGASVEGTYIYSEGNFNHVEDPPDNARFAAKELSGGCPTPTMVAQFGTSDVGAQKVN